MRLAKQAGGGMNPTERRAAISLAGLFSLRMLGLFMILPVFALYAQGLVGYTPALVGLAIGIYGLSQAILQIPFGLASDRFGRKPVIALGLSIFALGSVVAALSTSMTGVIIGRAIQGAGAISGPVMALAADLTREEQRTKAMALIGMSIGASFAIALVSAPIVDHLIGVPGIFALIAVLAMLGLWVLYVRVPTPIQNSIHRDAETIPAQLVRVLLNGQLLRLNLGILVLHAVLTANWVALPVMLSRHLDTVHHWWVYLPVLLVSVALMLPFIIQAERRGRPKAVFIGAIAALIPAQAALSQGEHGLLILVGALLLFFTAFNLLEATLPSLVSRLAPADAKGTAMGIYSTTQFLGVFLGGVWGGWIQGHAGTGAVFWFGAMLVLIWWLVALGMQPPGAQASRLLHIGEVGDAARARELAGRLSAIPGVTEAVVVVGDPTAYLKVDAKILNEELLLDFAVPEPRA